MTSLKTKKGREKVLRKQLVSWVSVKAYCLLLPAHGVMCDIRENSAIYFYIYSSLIIRMIIVAAAVIMEMMINRIEYY